MLGSPIRVQTRTLQINKAPRAMMPWVESLLQGMDCVPPLRQNAGCQELLRILPQRLSSRAAIESVSRLKTRVFSSLQPLRQTVYALSRWILKSHNSRRNSSVDKLSSISTPCFCSQIVGSYNTSRKHSI